MIRQLLAADARWSEKLRLAERPGPLRSLAILLAHSGDSWFWGIALILIAWRGDAFWKIWALWIFIGIALTAILVQTLKWVVRRQRPPGEWGAIYRSTDPHSFPSGHAARMAMLLVLGFALGPLWFGLLLIAWAPLVALARVAMGVHYLSDILGGAIIGAAIGLALIRLI